MGNHPPTLIERRYRKTLDAVAAVCDCRTEAALDAHRAPLQEDRSVVAAVYDCRTEANFGAHRAPLQGLG